MHKTLFILVIICICNITICSGQNNTIYKLDKNNGLNTNHIYCTLVDTLGYLWLGTDNGVYRYNGYTVQRYTYKEGLPSIDVWKLTLDKKGRIWLHSIADGIGYIKNNKYKRVAASFKKDFYATHIQDLEDSIFFFNAQLTGYGEKALCKVYNDTLYKCYIKFPKNENLLTAYVCKNGTIINAGEEGYLNKYRIPYFLSDTTYNIEDLFIKTLPGYYDHFHKRYSTLKADYYGDYILHNYTQNGSSKIIFQNSTTGKTDSISFTSNNQKETIRYMHHTKDKLMVMSDEHGYLLNEDFKLIHTYNFDSLFYSPNDEKPDKTFFIDDSIWKYCLSTTNQGVLIRFGQIKHYKKLTLDLSGYTFAGNIDHNLGYWWNKETKKLIMVSNGRIIKQYHLPDIDKITKVKKVGNHTNPLILGNSLKWLLKDGATVNFSKGISTALKDNQYGKDRTDIYRFLGAVKDILQYQQDEYVIIGTGDLGVYKGILNFKKKTLKRIPIDLDRYYEVLPDNYHKRYVLYTKKRLLILDSALNKEKVIDSKTINDIGLQPIKKAFIDSHGNLFIKDYSNLYLFNTKTLQITKLLEAYNLENTFIDIVSDTLTIAGEFGITRYRSDTTGKLTQIKTIPNTKSLFYTTIYDAQILEETVLLNTDKGSLLFDLKQESEQKASKSFNLIINYNESLYKIKSNDTLALTPKARSLGVDVINPKGTGQFQITYIIDGVPQNSSGNQIILPKLTADKHHNVSISIHDDVWRSKPVEFTIYIQPQWWQTKTMKIVFTICGIITIALIILLVINTTRKIVNRNNEKRTRERELELKSIYSQINPHFIFNTLGTAQYFIKKKQNSEAEEHISRFSELLRSYISSSRNKYITIGAEIENLHNYLELQLSRFGEKFKYKIVCNEKIKHLKIPSMLLQPIVENAINHGLFHKTDQGLLSISFNENTDTHELICIVDDDGIGRAKSKELKTAQMNKATSYGTILIKELINTINKYENISVNLKYLDKTLPDTGTTVIITITNYNNA